MDRISNVMYLLERDGTEVKELHGRLKVMCRKKGFKYNTLGKKKVYPVYYKHPESRVRYKISRLGKDEDFGL